MAAAGTVPWVFKTGFGLDIIQQNIWKSNVNILVLVLNVRLQAHKVYCAHQ